MQAVRVASFLTSSRCPSVLLLIWLGEDPPACQVKHQAVVMAWPLVFTIVIDVNRWNVVLPLPPLSLRPPTGLSWLESMPMDCQTPAPAVWLEYRQDNPAMDCEPVNEGKLGMAALSPA